MTGQTKATYLLSLQASCAETAVALPATVAPGPFGRETGRVVTCISSAWRQRASASSQLRARIATIVHYWRTSASIVVDRCVPKRRLARSALHFILGICLLSLIVGQSNRRVTVHADPSDRLAPLAGGTFVHLRE